MKFTLGFLTGIGVAAIAAAAVTLYSIDRMMR